MKGARIGATAGRFAAALSARTGTDGVTPLRGTSRGNARRRASRILDASVPLENRFANPNIVAAHAPTLVAKVELDLERLGVVDADFAAYRLAAVRGADLIAALSEIRRGARHDGERARSCGSAFVDLQLEMGVIHV